jgi:hypothetical protein
MYVCDQLLIVILVSSSGMVAMLGMGARPSKTLVEAEVYDGFTVSCGGIAVPLIIARPLGVSILLIFIRQA